MTNVIRILHLSDIHFRTSKMWDADPIMRDLAGFIGEDIGAGMHPDLILFTGDLAFSGAAEEYQLAKTWLETKLWPVLPAGFQREHMLFIPGNHDVDRSKVKRSAKGLQEDLLKAWSQDEITAVLADEDERDLLMKRHTAYIKFLREWTGEEQPLTWWQRNVDLEGTTLHIAGLNSAWMSFGDEDRSHLLLGRYQLTQTVETAEADGADWRLVMMHHPWDYLAEFESGSMRSAVHQRADILLRGHLHATQSERVVPPDASRQCLELAAGCLYDGSEHPNAFQWIELSKTGMAKQIRVHYRIWQRNAWMIDRNQPACPDGHANFELETHAASARPKSPAAPGVPEPYAKWLWGKCASIELLGQDIKQGQAITLSQVYVPAVTQSGGDGRAEERAGRAPSLDEEEKRPLLLERLDHTSLFVSAPAGGGKSTFCRWAVLQALPMTPPSHPVEPPKGYAEPIPTSLRDRLPLLVPLREFAVSMRCAQSQKKWQCADLETSLAAWIDQSPPPELSGDVLRAHLRAGSAFILFDGLDEVAISEDRDGSQVYPRELLLSGLADALPVWERAGNRLLLTSRPYGIDETRLRSLRLEQAPLAPLPEELQTLFVKRWFQTLNKPDVASQLLDVMQSRADLAPLIANPLLLTAVCVLYDNGGRLPEDRYELYKRIVDVVLHGRYTDDTKERTPVLRRLEAIAYGMHAGDLSDLVRETPAAEISFIETERLLTGFAEANPEYESGQVMAAIQRDELLHRTGLFVPRPKDRAGFYHLSFQEFLAAQRILRKGDPERFFEERGSVAEWRPTLLFLFAGQIETKEPRWGLDLLADLIREHGAIAKESNPAPLILIAEALDICLAKTYQIPTALSDAFIALAAAAIDHEIDLTARQAVGLTLGRLGDPRIVNDLRDRRAYVEIAAGSYPYGNEGDQNVEIKAPFLLSRYPITNDQFRAFIDDGGYETETLWSTRGWEWRKAENVDAPRHWRDHRFNAPNQPVVGVSFWEAEAFATWADARLPSEHEWEAAACGFDGRGFPWGDDWKDGICNSAEARLRVTSPVGSFPSSRNAEGLEDMAGNVLEWCLPFEDGVSDSEDDRLRVLRGGSWGSSQGNARCAARGGYDRSFRHYGVGFRVVCSSPILGTDP